MLWWSLQVPDTAPIVAELVQSTSYGRFQQIVNDSVGSENGWNQIAQMFRLTQSAVQMAGMETAVARQITDMTLKYFEDRFADWIVGKGGWVGFPTLSLSLSLSLSLVREAI